MSLVSGNEGLRKLPLPLQVPTKQQADSQPADEACVRLRPQQLLQDHYALVQEGYLNALAAADNHFAVQPYGLLMSDTAIGSASQQLQKLPAMLGTGLLTELCLGSLEDMLR